MDITVKIEAPDLAKAIMALAEAIGWHTASQANPELARHAAPKPELVPTQANITPPPEQPQPELAPPVTEPPVQATAETVSVAQLQQKAAELTRSGKRDQVKAIINQFGANKISEVPEDQRAACLAALGAA